MRARARDIYKVDRVHSHVWECEYKGWGSAHILQESLVIGSQGDPYNQVVSGDLGRAPGTNYTGLLGFLGICWICRFCGFSHFIAFSHICWIFSNFGSGHGEKHNPVNSQDIWGWLWGPGIARISCTIPQTCCSRCGEKRMFGLQCEPRAKINNSDELLRIAHIWHSSRGKVTGSGRWNSQIVAVAAAIRDIWRFQRDSKKFQYLLRLAQSCAHISPVISTNLASPRSNYFLWQPDSSCLSILKIFLIWLAPGHIWNNARGQPDYKYYYYLWIWLSFYLYLLIIRGRVTLLLIISKREY